jgi:cellulose synthase/poly-beta-1,6-N-acetylglucosamine synthase-like glycosyltransferase
MFNNLRTIIINFQTPDLLKTAIESFRIFYPTSQMTIIDNGSKDSSRELIEEMRRVTPKYTTTLLLESNIFHGPAMNQAMNQVTEEYVFFLDSDTEIKQGGFLEPMLSELETSVTAYGIGRQITVNKRGFSADTGVTLLAPAYMMLRRHMYSNFPPFEHHGQPVLKNFIAAQHMGYTLKSFPIENFIDHQWRGTASRFGYGLGWRGKIDFVLNKFGI